MNQVFTNIPPLLDWMIRLVTTVVAVTAAVDRIFKRVFKRHFDENIKTTADALDNLAGSIDEHLQEHRDRKHRW